MRADATSLIVNGPRYFRLSDDLHYQGRWHLGGVLDEGGDEPHFLASDPPAPGSLQVELSGSGIPLDFTLTAFAVPVVHQRIRELLVPLVSDDVRFLPASIGQLSEHSVMHVASVVDCLDERHSIFTKWSEQDGRPDRVGRYRMVIRLRLDPVRVPAHASIFRVRGWSVALIVREDIKEALQRAFCLGALFEDVTGALST